MNTIKAIFFLTLMFFCHFSFAQTLTQTISGKILEVASEQSVPFANVQILGTNPLLGTTSNEVGEFKISHVPIGRYQIQISFVGYQTKTIDVVLTSLKPQFIEVRLHEDAFNLQEVTVIAQQEKSESVNQMLILGGHTLGVEEARRYAGGFDDPARLASSFAGVASNVGNNGVVVRGNAPKGMLWRMEGVEIPNPNHFADILAFGGGGLTALSSHLLANSDFLLSAFPAEYGNALSGVFDINIRKGNTDKRYHALQVSALGIDVGSEGAFVKGKKSSYIFNYRYSMLGLLAPLLPENAGSTKYQDLSFKIHVPTKKAGTFELWGISALDNSGQKPLTNASERIYEDHFIQTDSRQYMGVMGLKHKIAVGKKSFLNSSFTSTANGILVDSDKLLDGVLNPKNSIRNNLFKHTFSTNFNTQISKRQMNRTGVNLNLWQYDIDFKNQENNTSSLKTIVNSKDQAFHLQAYTQSLFELSRKFSMNVGAHFQYLALNQKFTIEPRLALEYFISEKQSLGIGYGMHSRIEPIYLYLTKTQVAGEEKQLNKNLDFTKAQHFVLSYKRKLNESLRLKAEVYYQHLYNVPVVENSSFSLINLSQNWFISDVFVNKGFGKNYGLDITLEKYLTKGFFYLLTTSIFNSTYQAGDGIWRNTRYNQNFLCNVLIGKEWKVGKEKNNVFAISSRMTYQGGERVTPVQEEKSIQMQEIIYDETKAFENQNKAAYVLHFTLNYQRNKPKHRSIWALQVLNALGAKEFNGYRYNFVKQSIEENREAIILPNISYKIEF